MLQTDSPNQVASELWPTEEHILQDYTAEDSDNELSIEAQIAKEVSAMKRPRPEPRFGKRHNNGITEGYSQYRVIIK